MAFSELKRLAAVALLACIAAAAFPGDWPDNPDGVVGSFAAASDGGFIPGLVFKADGQRVQAWSTGELVWSSGPGYMDGAVPSTGLVVIEHPDGFRSAYLNVEARPDSESRIVDGQWIGYAGNESWMFVVRDSEMNKVIDPLTLLPTREDLASPRLGDVVLASGDTRLTAVSGMVIDSGRWSIILDSAYIGGEAAIPAELSLYWVGEHMGMIRLDSLEERDGVVLVDAPDPVTHEAIYNSDGNLIFRDILLNAGRGILELRISDETGRVIRKTWNLTIRSY